MGFNVSLNSINKVFYALKDAPPNLALGKRMPNQHEAEVGVKCR